ncbi:MAG: poly-gamma-glutamate system protein [candidate division Zixibacteria bacterium]|nr:poly-gamma-glutamate system protein [Candidatus Tariuqbacter arcticus]
MFKPSIKSPLTTAILAVIALLLYFLSENTRREVKAPYYDVKITAAEEMLRALETIHNHRLTKGVIAEELGDPLAISLVGQQYSLTTTEVGLLSSKLTAINPNFAGAIVDMLKQAGVQAGDKIAVATTGSLPGLNLALFSACKVLGAAPVQITSLGSSSWGANEVDFTWLDMEKVLLEEGIFDFRSTAASLGGGNDIGIGLSQLGRQTLREAAARNDIPLIEESDLQASIAKRMEIYGKIQDYKAFVNTGGGIAALGHPANNDIIEPGFNHRLLPKNYPGIGVINLFGSEIPVIHLSNLDRLRRQYDLPLAPNPLPPIGVGRVFAEEKYDLRVTSASLILIALLLMGIFRMDKKIFKFSEDGADPDSLI